MNPLTNPPTLDELRAAYEAALQEELVLEQQSIAAEILAADNDPEHIRAFHAIESEYWGSWGRTTQAYLAWDIQRKWEGVRAA